MGYSDRNSVTVQLVDKQQVTAPTDDIIIVGGAGPCPMLATGDYVLARVRTKDGPHPSEYGGLSDCYIPGTVQGCPKDVRKGGALYLVLDFSGRGITCSRYGIIKIGRSKYTELFKFIKDNGTRPLHITESDDDDDVIPSQGHSSSRLSSVRGSIHIPSADALPHPSDIPRASSATSMLSRSGSRASSARSAQSHSGSRASLPEGRRDPEQSSSPFPENEEVKMLLEQQKVQGELLEHQQRELSLMSLRQQELEEQIRTQTRHSPMASPGPGEESPDFFDQNPRSQDVPPTEVISPPHDPSPSPSSSEGEGPTGPVLREQAVNTDVWTEEKGVVTDPMTESRGVGTEWSDSSSTESDLVSESVSATSDESTPAHSNSTVSPGHDHVTLTPPASLTLSPPPSSVVTPLPTPEEEADRHLEATPTDTTPTNVTPTNVTPEHTPSHVQSYHNLEEEDPLINQYVLARWPDDGWYYRGVVMCHLGQMWYQVKDASQDVEKIHALDIIIDLQDAQRPLLAGDTAAALHPCFNRSYAPGIVKGAAADGLHFSVVLYDGTEAFLPRQEIYHLAQAKHQQDVEFLRKKEKVWVGQAVLARRDRDGLYLPGRRRGEGCG